MKTLPPANAPAAILSFDFDGTLHDPASDPPVPHAFFDLIRALRETRQVVWGINTGRSVPQMVDGMIESRFPFLPDWMVAREREIYFPNNIARWMPHAPWNERCGKEIHGLFKRTRKLMARIRHEVEHHTGAQWFEYDGEPAGLISRTEEEMEWIVAHIAPIAADEAHLSWQRNSIYLRFGHRDYQKGSSLAEITRIYQLSTDRCFAMGDSHNDEEMLDPARAAMIACPANAVDSIQRKVALSNGFVTRAVHGHGAIEALEHFFPLSKEEF